MRNNQSNKSEEAGKADTCPGKHCGKYKEQGTHLLNSHAETVSGIFAEREDIEFIVKREHKYK